MDFSGDVTFEGSASQSSETRQISHGTATDVTESGLCFITKDVVTEDQILKISLPLPGVPVQAPTLGIVKWVRSDNGGYKVGMKFIL